MRVPCVRNKSVLITGCSSGIGRALAVGLRERGWRVFPTARRDQDLAALKDEGFEAVALDLASPDSVDAAFRQVVDLGDGALGGVVNNAGFAQAGAIEDVSRDDLRRQFEVNLFGLHQLTRKLIPVFRQAGCGRVVNVSSVYGRIAVPMVGSYCASKFALEAYSDALRVELRAEGIAVSLVEPGAIISNFRNNAAATAEQTVGDNKESRFQDAYNHEIQRRRKGRKKKANFFTRPPEEVVPPVVHALESPRPRARYGVTPAAPLVAIARRVLPESLLDRIRATQLPHS